MILYGLHLVVLGILQYIHFAFIRRNPHLLERPIGVGDATAATRRILFGPAMFAVAMLVALFSARTAYAVYFFVLFVYIVISLRERSIVGH